MLNKEMFQAAFDKITTMTGTKHPSCPECHHVLTWMNEGIAAHAKPYIRQHPKPVPGLVTVVGVCVNCYVRDAMADPRRREGMKRAYLEVAAEQRVY
jgi:hypothetical protein